MLKSTGKQLLTELKCAIKIKAIQKWYTLKTKGNFFIFGGCWAYGCWDGKTCRYCRYICAIFFFCCANLFGCIRANQLKHCAISTVMKVIYQKHTVLLTQYTKRTMLKALCYLHFAISTVLLALGYKDSAVSSVLRWLNSREFTLF